MLDVWEYQCRGRGRKSLTFWFLYVCPTVVHTAAVYSEKVYTTHSIKKLVIK